MPSFAGVDIFGSAVSMTPAVNPRDVQINTFPGLNGLERLDGGSRGRVTQVRGTHIGVGAAGLAAAQGLFLSFYDGQAHTLVDTLGRAWPNVVLERFQATGRVGQAPDGRHLQDYTAEFLHL